MWTTARRGWITLQLGVDDFCWQHRSGQCQELGSYSQDAEGKRLSSFFPCMSLCPSVRTHFGSFHVLPSPPNQFGLPGCHHYCFFILNFSWFLISGLIFHRYFEIPILFFATSDCNPYSPWGPFTTPVPWCVVFTPPVTKANPSFTPQSPFVTSPPHLLISVSVGSTPTAQQRSCNTSQDC